MDHGLHSERRISTGNHLRHVILLEIFSANCGNFESGELNVAAGESTNLYILPEPIKRFADRYPGIQLK